MILVEIHWEDQLLIKAMIKKNKQKAVEQMEQTKTEKKMLKQKLSVQVKQLKST